MQKKYKILFRVKVFPILSETFIVNHLKMIIDNGFEVRILAKAKQSISFSAQPIIIKEYCLLEKTNELKDYDLSSVSKKLIFVITTIFRYPKMFKYLKTFNFFKYGKQGIKGNLFYKLFTIYDYLEFDIVHIQFGINTDPFIDLKKHNLLKQKVVVTFHGFDAHFNEDSKNARQNFYKALFKYADLITANTLYLKEQLNILGCKKNKIKVMPMPVDTSFFTPKSVRERFSHLFL